MSDENTKNTDTDTETTENPAQAAQVENGEIFAPIEQNGPVNPAIPDVLNLLPLRDAVLFPQLVAPIGVGRAPFVKLVDDSVVDGSRVLGMVTQRDAETEAPGPTDIYPTGVAVTIRLMDKRSDGTRLIVQGLQRFQILQVLETEPYIRARVKLIDEAAQMNDADPLEIEALKRQLSAQFEKVVDLSPEMPEELKNINGLSDAGAMADLMAAHLGRLSTPDKMAVLETLDVKERMNTLLGFLTREAQVLELGANLQNQVAGEMNKAQRDYFLREQMKAIQKELGEGDDRAQELDDLKTKIAEADLPDEARKEAEREFDRLQRMSPGAPEYTVSRTYLDLIVALPWNTSSDDNLEIAEVKRVLDEDHYGLEKVKDRILEYLSVRKFKKEGAARQPILCLVGPPGVGKTSLGKSIARALDKKFLRLSLGGRARRGRNQRASAHLYRGDARSDNSGVEADGNQQSAVYAG